MERHKTAGSVYLRWAIIFCLVAVVFITLGVLYYRYEAQHIKDDKFEEISAIAKLKADSIQEWRRNRLADVKRVPGPLVRRETARLLQDQKNPGARAALQIQLNINRKGTIYADALFLDTKGNILLSDSPNPAPVDQATVEAIEAALKDRKEVLSEFYRDSKGIIYIDAVAPVPDNSGTPIAIIVLRSKATDFLFPLIRTWPTPSKTAETVLVRRDGDSILFLNELRHRSNTALTLRFPLTHTTLPAIHAALGEYDRFYGRDYRGVDVLAVGQPVLQSTWFIVAKVDAKEVLAEVRYRAWVITIIVVLLILISAGLTINMYQNRQEIERKKAEETLKESEERFKSLYQEGPIPTFTWKKKRDDFILVDFNRAMIQVTNGKVSDYLGSSATELYRNRPDILDNMDLCYKKQSAVRREIVSRNFAPGRLFSVYYGFVPPDLIIVHTEDITERKRAEEALKESESRLATIFENDPSGIILVNVKTHTIHDANQAAVEMVGLPKEDLVGKVCHNFICPAEEGRCPIRDLGQEVDRSERALVCADGKRLPILKTVVPIKMSGEEYLLENFIDITERKLAEENLKQAMEKLRKSLVGTIQAMSLMVETRDPYTSGHQKRVSNLARVIAREMGFPNDTVDTIRMAGIIHDIGKISVPAEILSKPTKLTAVEFSLIKVHSRAGYDILKDVDLPYPIAEIVLQHHEKLDGSGYPQGLKDTQILPETRILVVADVVEAMASHRPYRPAIGIEKALEEIEANKGIFYDTKAVDACVRLFREKGFTFETTSS